MENSIEQLNLGIDLLYSPLISENYGLPAYHLSGNNVESNNGISNIFSLSILKSASFTDYVSRNSNTNIFENSECKTTRSGRLYSSIPEGTVIENPENYNPPRILQNDKTPLCKSKLQNSSGWMNAIETANLHRQPTLRLNESVTRSGKTFKTDKNKLAEDTVLFDKQTMSYLQSQLMKGLNLPKVMNETKKQLSLKRPLDNSDKNPSAFVISAKINKNTTRMVSSQDPEDEVAGNDNYKPTHHNGKHYQNPNSQNYNDHSISLGNFYVNNLTPDRDFINPNDIYVKSEESKIKSFKCSKC